MLHGSNAEALSKMPLCRGVCMCQGPPCFNTIQRPCSDRAPCQKLLELCVLHAGPLPPGADCT